MPDSAVAVPARRRLPRPSPGAASKIVWRPAWSVPAAMRALRATIVIPALFALTFKVVGDPQMALFATFGGFATLVLASFGGTRRNKAVAHLGLAVAGSALLVVGTLVSGTVWLAALVTVPVAFGVFFAGVAGPNAAAGVTGALLAYVLPVASTGTAAMVGSRLEGWWLASAASTAAVLLLSPRSAGDRLRAAAAASAAALASHLAATVAGRDTPEDHEASVQAKHELMNVFVATPYRPTGLATADQAMANVVQLLEWCTSLMAEIMDGHLDLSQAAPVDRELLGTAAALLEDVSWLLGGQDVTGRDVNRDIDRLERGRAQSAAHQWDLSGDSPAVHAMAAFASHAQAIAVTARSAAADAMIAAGRADPVTVAAERRSWIGGEEDGSPAPPRRFGAVVDATELIFRHASPRSVWFRSSVRGAIALAAAVAIADLSGVQHGFWVVLGTLSVLRTSAAATGSTVMRALAGTVAGFVIGAALLLAIGTGPAALWIALPIAILVAAYAPGTAPFAVGQAAFTITVVVLFNLLAPAGWKVGLLRIQDVALGCAVSFVIGVLFWPRGAGPAVGDDLADAFRRGAAYLTQAVDWSLGLRPQVPDAAFAAVTAGIRLDDALRLFLAENGTKRVPKEDLWRLVMATMRLRLTAHSLAVLPARTRHDGPPRPPGADGAVPPPGADGAVPPPGADGREAVMAASAALRRVTADLAEFYERVAVEVGPPRRDQPQSAAVAVPDLRGLADDSEPGGAAGEAAGTPRYHARALWVREHLQHLGAHAQDIPAPAERVAQMRRVPWWR
jgi:uncharacterized membrane protein YccC